MSAAAKPTVKDHARQFVTEFSRDVGFAMSDAQQEIMLNLFIKHAPPAQSIADTAGAKLVAWFEAEESCRGVDLRKIDGMIHSTRLHWQEERPQTGNPVWPLYAYPSIDAAPSLVPVNSIYDVRAAFEEIANYVADSLPADERISVRKRAIVRWSKALAKFLYASPAIDAAGASSMADLFNAREVIAAMILEHEDGGLTARTVQRGRDICYSPFVTPKAAERCDMGVGCEEYGVCYAAANGEPDRCYKNAIDAAGASEGDVRKQLTEALGLPTNGVRDGKPIGFSWEYLIAMVRDLAKENGDE